MYTGTYLNPGNSSFAEKVHGELYVDKTDLIKFVNRNLCTMNKFICSTRPRRFGKSMAIDMLTAYYSKGCDSRNLFQGLNVEKYDMNDKKEAILSRKYMEYMNAYDVITFDMQWVMTRVEHSIDATGWIQNQVIEELGNVYPECIKEGDDLPGTLLEINRVTGRQFVILIDEWDALFRLDKENVEAQEKYITFLRAMFKGQAAEKFVALAYITGILPIKKYGTESALNNFREYTMVEPKKMIEYMGFTEEEVKTLCQEYHMDFEEIQKWYDGYNLYGQHIYSPNSVVEAVTNERITNYWVSTDTYESLRTYIALNFEGLKDDVTDMLAGGRIKVRINLFKNDIISFNSKNDVLVCLVHLGYLSYDSNTGEVFIPNNEVRKVFEDTIQETDWTEVIRAIEASDKLLKNTLAKNAEEVAKVVEYVHANATSINRYNDENSLSCAITLAYYSAMNDYYIFRELPSGVGYADVVFLPRPNVTDKPAIVVELKCNQDAGTAIQQIKDRKYGEHLKDYTGKVLLVGINYQKEDKNKTHTCEIEELEK